jgi:hypothetical protein
VSYYDEGHYVYPPLLQLNQSEIKSGGVYLMDDGH